MFKQLLRFCSRKSLAPSKFLKKPLLIPPIQRSIFFSFKQDTKPAKKKEEDVDNFKDISFLINKIKEDNKKLPPLLPPKAAEDKDKLTVVMEMDEVLLYVFYPDENEGYLQAPLRYPHFPPPHVSGTMTYSSTSKSTTHTSASIKENISTNFSATSRITRSLFSSVQERRITSIWSWYSGFII